MYLEDLSSYRCHGCDGLPGVLPVGWLSGAHPFRTGALHRALVDKLMFLAIFKSTHFTRGMHRCELCAEDEIHAERNGVVRFLGSAEIWVPGEGLLYAAPNLLVHYVTAHRYLPPDEFVRALEALDVHAWAPPQDYAWRQRALGGAAPKKQ